MLTARFGKGSMDNKCSAIQEYCEACRRRVGIPGNGVTGYELHEQHLKQQDLLLEIIQEQSRPQFGREVLANITGDFAYDILKVGLKGLTKLL